MGLGMPDNKPGGEGKSMGIGFGNIANLAGAGMNIAFRKSLQEEQFTNQRRMQQMQIAGAKEMSDYQYDQQMAMWEATGYGAQMKQMKEAGLNPNLMYGGAGSGGQLGSGGGAMPSGGQVDGVAAGQNAITGMGMMAAQMGLIQAQTEKTKAEAANIGAEGIDTKVKETQIASLSQGIENQKVQQGLMKAQTTLAELDGEFAGKSMEDRLENIQWVAHKAMNEAELSFQEAYVAKATQVEKINIIKAEAIAATLRNDATKAGIALTKEEARAIGVKLTQEWTRIEQGERGLDQGDIKLGQEGKKLNLERRNQDVSERNVKQITETTLKAAGIAASGAALNNIGKFLEGRRGRSRSTDRYNNEGELIGSTMERMF